MLSNPTAFADVVLPHAKPANKQFLGKKPADLRQIRDFSRPQVSGRQSRLPPEAIIGGTPTIIGIESPPADWLGAQLPRLDRQAPFNFQLASTKPASSPSPNWTVQYTTQRRDASCCGASSESIANSQFVYSHQAEFGTCKWLRGSALSALAHRRSTRVTLQSAGILPRSVRTPYDLAGTFVHGCLQYAY